MVSPPSSYSASRFEITMWMLFIVTEVLAVCCHLSRQIAEKNMKIHHNHFFYILSDPSLKSTLSIKSYNFFVWRKRCQTAVTSCHRHRMERQRNSRNNSTARLSVQSWKTSSQQIYCPKVDCPYSCMGLKCDNIAV